MDKLQVTKRGHRRKREVHWPSQYRQKKRSSAHAILPSNQCTDWWGVSRLWFVEDCSMKSTSLRRRTVKEWVSQLVGQQSRPSADTDQRVLSVPPTAFSFVRQPTKQTRVSEWLTGKGHLQHHQVLSHRKNNVSPCLYLSSLCCWG